MYSEHVYDIWLIFTTYEVITFMLTDDKRKNYTTL